MGFPSSFLASPLAKPQYRPTFHRLWPHTPTPPSYFTYVNWLVTFSTGYRTTILPTIKIYLRPIKTDQKSLNKILNLWPTWTKVLSAESFIFFRTVIFLLTQCPRTTSNHLEMWKHNDLKRQCRSWTGGWKYIRESLFTNSSLYIVIMQRVSTLPGLVKTSTCFLEGPKCMR